MSEKYLVIIFPLSDLNQPQAMAHVTEQLYADPDRAVAMYITEHQHAPLSEVPELRDQQIKAAYDDSVMHCGLRYNSTTNNFSCTERAFTSFALDGSHDHGCLEIQFAVTSPDVSRAVYAMSKFCGSLYEGAYNIPSRWRDQPFEAVVEPRSTEHPYIVVSHKWEGTVAVDVAQATITLIVSGSSQVNEDSARAAHAKTIELYNAGILATTSLRETSWFK